MTSAPGMTPPDESTMTPVTEPVLCAETQTDHSSNRAPAMLIRFSHIPSPLCALADCFLNWQYLFYRLTSDVIVFSIFARVYLFQWYSGRSPLRLPRDRGPRLPTS